MTVPFVLASRALAVVETTLAAKPQLVARVASRLTLPAAKATVQGILEAIKNNKIFAALTLYELGDAGLLLLRELFTDDEQISALPFFPKVDDVKDVMPEFAKANTMDDELIAIENAIEIVKGKENFVALRTALLCSDQTFRYWEQERTRVATVFSRMVRR